MGSVMTLTADELDLVGGSGFFERVGWAFDNPGTAAGRMADRFFQWYRLTPDEDPSYFID